MANKYTYHTYPSDDELVRLIEEHRTYVAVARHLNMTGTGLHKHIAKRPGLKERMNDAQTLNLHDYPKPEELEAMMRRLGSYAAIARETGCSRHALEVHTKRVGLKASLDGIAQELRCYPSDDEFYEAMKELRSLKHVALRFGIPERSFWSHLYSRPDLKKRLDEFNRLHVTREEIRQKRKAYRKRWLEKNVDIIRARRFKTGSRVRGSEPSAEAMDYVKLIRKDVCSYCGSIGGTIDHIVPLSAGGDSDWDNLAAACRSCNSRKNTKPLLEFLLAM